MASTDKIASLGIGSGLDLGALVAKMMSVEKRVLKTIASRSTNYNNLISAYGTIKSALSTYQTALKSATFTNFNAQKSDVVNRGSGDGLTTDAFTAEVNKDLTTVALPQKIQSDPFAKNTLFRSGDSLAIKVGKATPTFITLSADTNLQGVSDAINRAKAGVTASIAKDDQGERLIIESNTTGNAGGLKVVANNSLTKLAFDSNDQGKTGMKQIQAAREPVAAVSGSHNIQVNQLAQLHKLRSGEIASGAIFDSGILAIKVGQNSTVMIKPANSSLAGVRDAINQSGAGVDATIVSDGNNAHLVITSKESGAAGNIRITGTESFSAFSFDPSGAINLPPVNANKTYDAGAGELTLKVGKTSTKLPLTGSNVSLATIRDAINKASSGVTASIEKVDQQERLVIKPSGAGATEAVSLTGSGSFSGLSGKTMGQLTAAQDAKINIDGIEVSSASNSVTKAIAGVTLNLKKVTKPQDKFNLSITNDVAGVQTAATSFVNAFNALSKVIANLTSYNPASKKGETLQGDSASLTMLKQLRNTVFESNDRATVRALSDAGVSFKKDGSLELDTAKFQKVAKDNFNDLVSLFTSSNGVVSRMTKLVDGFLNDEGVIENKIKGLKTSVKVNEDKYVHTEARLAEVERRYTRNFTALDRTVARMQATQSFLTTELARLGRRQS